MKGNTNNLKKDVLDRKNLINKLSFYCSRGKRDSTNLVLNNIPIEDSMFIDYLVNSFKGDESYTVRTFWADLSKNEFKYKSNFISTVSNQEMALYIITAMYYKDYFFAFDRKLYNNNCINLKNDSTLFDINDYFSCILDEKNDKEIEKIWKQVVHWKENGMQGRPFGNLPYYWLGEEGGKLNRFNTKMTKLKWLH